MFRRIDFALPEQLLLFYCAHIQSPCVPTLNTHRRIIVFGRREKIGNVLAHTLSPEYAACILHGANHDFVNSARVGVHDVKRTCNQRSIDSVKSCSSHLFFVLCSTSFFHHHFLSATLLHAHFPRYTI